MNYKAVLFDLDGTLLDTLRDIAVSTNRALGCFGFPPHSLEAYKYFIGDGREALALRALPEHQRDAATLSRLVARMGEEYAAHWADNTCPYEGVPELLDALTARGVAMSILSNKPNDFTELMTSRLLGRWHFQIVAGALPDVPRKPSPAAALDIARRLSLKPGEFLYVGDSDIDMKTAVAAGMHPVGATWGFRTPDELLAGGAKDLIERPGDLLELM
ncbi:MAG: HAD family hydrolase [Chloroflexi bacterium]|nr:HAD family hydrolase [Chloroflexota bacterium]